MEKIRKEYKTGAYSEREGRKLTIGKGNLKKEYCFTAKDIIDLSPLLPVYSNAVKRGGADPTLYCMAGGNIIARQFIPEVEECINFAKKIEEKQKEQEKKILEDDIKAGIAFRAVEIANQWGTTLTWARRFTEKEKGGYAEWYKERGMVGYAASKKTKVKESAVRKIITRESNGMFLGCDNQAWIITEEEWNQIIELSEDITKSILEQKQKFETKEEKDLQNKIKTGFCFSCETWCYGDCGNYQKSPSIKFKRDFQQAQK